MKILEAWRELEEQKEKFRYLEKILELPKNSIQSEYEKELVLSGMPIKEVKKTHSDLIEISQSVVYGYEIVISVHRRIKDINRVRKIMKYASSTAINPHSIIDSIFDLNKQTV